MENLPEITAAIRLGNLKSALKYLRQGNEDDLKIAEELVEGVVNWWDKRRQVDFLKEHLARAFKKTICAEMGKSGSSLYALQTFPIAVDVAKALGYDVRTFLRDCGWADHVISERLKNDPT